MKKFFTGLAGGVVLFTVGCFGSANAGTVTVDAVNSGWYSSEGLSSGHNHNIFTGLVSYRDWLGFDLNSITGTITSAILEVYSRPIINDSNQTIEWYDVTTSYSSLGILNDPSIYSDLGTGVMFASGIQNPGINNFFTINNSGLVSLNAATSFWAIGGKNISEGRAFGGFGVGYETIRLTLETTAAPVPEPSTIVLFGAGLAGLIGAWRRKKA